MIHRLHAYVYVKFETCYDARRLKSDYFDFIYTAPRLRFLQEFLFLDTPLEIKKRKSEGYLKILSSQKRGGYRGVPFDSS
jgi:hypothetical protein